MPIHNQSDYGYTTGGIEVRTVELCLSRANWCEEHGKIEMAQRWREEAKDLGWKS